MRKPTVIQHNNTTDPLELSAMEKVADVAEEVRTVAAAVESGSIDLANGNAEDIGKVAQIGSDVSAVAAIDQHVQMLSSNLDNIDTVVQNLGATLNCSNNMATLLLLHGRMADIMAVASVAPDIDALGTMETEIRGVYQHIPEITTVVSHMADVVFVAQNGAALETIHTNITDLLLIAANMADVNTVATNMDAINEAVAGLAYSLKYLGAHDSAPSLRLNGAPIEDGDYYLDTVENALVYYVESTDSWINVDPQEILAARDVAVDAKIAAETAQGAAEAASATATTKADEASASAATANTHKLAAEAARTGSESARDISVNSATLAEGYKDTAEAARDITIQNEIATTNAKNTAVLRADEAAVSAQTAVDAKDVAVAKEAIATAAANSATASEGVATSKATQATNSANAAGVNAGLAEDHKNAAEAAKDTTLIYKDNAESAKNAAAISASNASGSEAEATLQQGLATQAKADAESAAIDAETHRDLAITNANRARDEADRAEAAATSIEGVYNKTEMDNLLNQKSDTDHNHDGTYLKQTEADTRYLQLSGGTLTGAIAAPSFVGNATTASKWATARTITLAGDATGSVSIDGGSNQILTVEVEDNSHNHTAANITDLTDVLATKSDTTHDHDATYAPIAGATSIGQVSANTLFGDNGKWFTNDGYGNIGLRFGYLDNLAVETGTCWEWEMNNDSANGTFKIQADPAAIAGEAVALKTIATFFSETQSMVVQGDVEGLVTSDITTKHKIEPIKGALDMVLGWDAFHYEYKSEFPISKLKRGKQTGFSAQQIEKDLPHKVEMADDGKLRIKQGGFEFEAVLVAALKEQQTQIDELKQMVKDLLNERS